MGREYMLQQPTSLLVRVAGLYQIQMRPAQDVFAFMVMFNVAPSKDVFCKYDLKGSTYKRTERSSDQHIKDKSSLTSQWDPNTKHHQYSGVLLDLDFEEDSHEFERPVIVSLQDKEKLLAQILQDVKFLAQHRVMDYSMLLCRAKCAASAELPASFHDLHCLRSASEDDDLKDECYFFSFLDITQEWIASKAMERYAKVYLLRGGKKAVSSAPPGYFAKRFVDRMNEYIHPRLDDKHPIMQEIALEDWRKYDETSWC